MTATALYPALAFAAATARQRWLEAVGAPGVNVIDVEWTTEVKPAAEFKAHTLTKRTRAKALTGVGYAQLAVNQGRVTGDLPWGSWVEGLYPYVIEHKGREYARLYTVDGSLETTYYVDGIEIERDDFNTFLTPAARKPKRPNGGVLSIKIENVRVI